MPSAKQRFVDLLATGRVANLPSVLSNTFLGAVLAWEFNASFDRTEHLPYSPNLLGPFLAAVCFYLGGCFLNDWHDAEWDRLHRPERAIPTGRTSAMPIGLAAFALLGAGLALSFLQGWPAGIIGLCLLAAIAIYTIIHKRSAWGVLLMGLCRALLYPLAFFSQPEPVHDPNGLSLSIHHISPFARGFEIGILVTLGIGLLAYIAGLSLFARHESAGTLRGNRRLLAAGLLCVPLLTHGCFWMAQEPARILIGLVPLSIVLVLVLFISDYRPQTRIGLLLAAIPLVDFICLPVLAQANWGHMVRAEHGFEHETALLMPELVCLVPLAAFVLGLLLQRLAPAS